MNCSYIKSFDLCIWMQERWINAGMGASERKLNSSVLPFRAVHARQDVGMVTRQLWQNIDDLITKPIERGGITCRRR